MNGSSIINNNIFSTPTNNNNNIIKRRITIIRNDSAGYGFTLSRSILYASLNNDYQDKIKNNIIDKNEDDLVPIEIVFVKHVKIESVAYLAGLREGDRPIYINGISLIDKTYLQIISLIENSGKLLELIVIPATSDNIGIISKNKSNEQQSKLNDYLLRPVNQNDNLLERLNSAATTSSSTIASTITAPSSDELEGETPTRELSPQNKYPSAIKTASPSILYQYHQHNQNMPQKQQQQSTTLSPLTEQKLRNLQQALTEHYSKEKLNELGIVIPDLVDKTKRNQQYNEYNHNHKSPIINNLQKKLIDSRQSSISSLSPTSNFNNQQQQRNLNQSPTIFSKYIESVHKALNSNNFQSQEINKENIQDFLDNNQNNPLSISKRFVEHRRQLFESQNSLSQKSTENLFKQKQEQENQEKPKQLRKFSMQSAPELTTTTTLPTSSNNNKSLNKQLTIDYYQDYHDNHNSLIRTSNGDSITNISSSMSPQQQQQLQQQLQQQNEQLQTISINFIQNNKNNNPLFTSECKRLMSRGYLESIAERAAHFEDIDPERYNRLKMKISTISNNSQPSINDDQNSTINLQHVINQQDNKNKNIQDLNPKYEPLVARYYYTANNLYANYNNNDKMNNNNRLVQQSQYNDDNKINKTLQQQQQQQQQQFTDNKRLFVEENNLKRRSITSSISPNRLNYNFNNYPASFNKNRLFSSDATSSTTTESDILSPPSSPQYNNNNNNMRIQQQQQQQQQQQVKIHYPIPIVDSNSSTNSTSSPATNMSKTTAAANIASAIVRQHSYLNAVRMNDEYLYRQQLKQHQQQQFQQQQQQQQQPQKPLLVKQQSFTFNDNESNSSSTTTNHQSPLIYQNNRYYNNNNDDYDLLQQQQQHQDVTKYIDSDNNSTPLNLTKYSQKQQTHRLKLRTPPSSSSQGINNNNDDDTRRHSYIKATNLYNNNNNNNNQQDDNSLFSKPPQQPSNSNLLQKQSQKDKPLSTPPQSSRNTSIKKLKNFFGEKTPVVLQAFETKNIIASDVFLNTILETVKEGVLNCKILSKDGKRSTDRSWKPAWAVLKKSGALFLCKEKKDNIMIPSVDSYPINLKNSTIFIPTDYTKRKNVFKVTTCSNSEYLFQTVDNESMLEWIQAMQENSNTDKIIISSSSSSSMSLEQQKLRRISFESNTLNPSSNLLTNNRLSLYEAKKMNNDYEQQKQQSGNNRLSDINNGSDSPPTNHHHRKEETSPRRDNNNRKWVRSMTRRIRDFMNSANNGDPSSNEFNTSTNSNDFSNKNFGVSLNKCEPSSISFYVPAVVEICTRLIELHLTDEGIYRKVGQKLVVNSLRSQMNKGIKYIDISDFNWDNPHAIVSLLKSFLNELPDSLITTNLYNDFIQVCRVENHHIRLISIKKLLKQLPINNYETLKYLSLHLRRVASAYQHNKMTVKNICIAFSQSIVRHNDANCETIKTDHLQQSLLIEIVLTYHDWLFDEQQQIESVIPNEIKDVELNLLQQYCPYIEPTSTSDLLLNIIQSICNKWNLNDQFNNFDNQQLKQQQPINIQFRSSKSVGAIVRNNIRSKDRSRSADLRIKSTTRSVPLLSALTLKSALQSSGGDDNKTKNSSNKSKTNLKMKKKNKQSKRQLIQENDKSPLAIGVPSTDALNSETKSINDDNDEKTLNETIKKEYMNFKTLEKRNQEEKEKLNELMKKLNDELITAQIDIMKEDYLVNNNNDFQATLQYRKQILEAASTTSTNSTSSLNNRIIQQQQLNNKLQQQRELKKLKSQRRRHTISSTRDHIPLNDLQVKSKINDQNLLIKINENELITTKATPVIPNNNNNSIKKPKITIVNQNSTNTVIKPNTKFKSLSNIHNQPSELSSISSYSSSIVPSTSSSSASTTSTTSSKCVFNNQNDTNDQQEQKVCNLFKDSIRLNSNNLVDQFESLI